MAPMLIEALLFDLDGTLVDSRQDLARALNRALAAYAVPPLPVAVVTDLVGEGALRLVERALPPELRPKVDEVLERFLGEYERGLVIDTRAYPGVPETLKTLSERFPLAVVTNKREALSARLLEALGLDRFVSLVVGPDTAGARKPSGRPLLFALERLGVERPGAAAMVGDSSFDILAARAGGLVAVGAAWGYRPRMELASADVLIDRIEELLDLFGSRVP